MMRSLKPMLALLVFGGCSSGHESNADPAAGDSGSGNLGTSGAVGANDSGLTAATGTVTGTSGAGASGMPSGAGASGMGPSGMGASGIGASGTDASRMSAADAGSRGGGTGGVSISDAGGMTGDAGSAPPTPGECVGDWKAGTYPPDFITGGGASSLPPIGGRNYAVHVPKGYDCHLPTPLVFCLHGLGQDGFMFCVNGTSTPNRKGGMPAKADEAGFIVVMSSDLGPAASDVKVVRDIFKNLETHLNIDHKRVYATGHSFGGSLSFLLACTAADLITAVAPNAWATLPASCAPTKPVAVLASIGDQDFIAPGTDQGPAIKTLAKLNGCSAMETPATVPVSGGDTTCVTHAGCMGGVEVTRCTIKGGGHTWFGDPTCGTGADACAIVGANSSYYVNTDFAWDFLKRFSR